MKVTIDPRYNIAYIKLREKTEEVEAIRISDELVLDIAPDGRIFGIELLNASEQIGKSDVLSLFDESTGKVVEVSLRS
ncbi:MAG: DUF2283 domain-containing protein [Spirochaetia bacterium]|jgi:uncharacterized protein YuzE